MDGIYDQHIFSSKSDFGLLVFALECVYSPHPKINLEGHNTAP